MLILASKSPRRKQLMESGGYDFQIAPVTVDERIIFDEQPAEYVRRIAWAKARKAADLARTEMSGGDLIISADTAVAYFEQNESQTTRTHELILGKPADKFQAVEMLERLRGGVHQVCTAIVVFDPFDNKTSSAIQFSTVKMRDYSDVEMETYINSGDPLDKAGGYAIQHPGFQPAQFVQGCYPNVMGLPVCRLRELLEEFGVFPSHKTEEGCHENSHTPCGIYTLALEIAGVGGNH